MTGSTDPTQSAQEPDDSLFDEYLDRLLDGSSPDPERFVAEHPQATPSLLGRLQALESLISREARTPAIDIDVDGDGTPAGRQLGGYRILRRIGRGGMGSVFLAEQQSLNRLVALKLVDPTRSSSPKARQRFLEEARMIAEISHPHIVRVIDFGEADDVQFMAMELVSGRDLETLLRDAAPNSIALHRKLGWFLQIARALDHAHRHGIVHRDVKPANIQITVEDQAVLLDFGLARPVDRETRTLQGAFLGTVAYASPEQVEAKSGWGAPATDVYSLGASLYRALGGRLPFEGESNEELLRNILLQDPVPLCRLDPTLPRDVQTVVQTAMERDPNHRYASMAAFAEDLQAVLELRPIRATPPSFTTRCLRWARRHPIRTNSLLLLVAVGVAAVVFSLLQDWREGHRTGQRIAALWQAVERALDDADRATAGLHQLAHDAESLAELAQSVEQDIRLERDGQDRALQREQARLAGQPEQRREIEAAIERIRDRIRSTERRRADWQASLRKVETGNQAAGTDLIAGLRGHLDAAGQALRQLEGLAAAGGRGRQARARLAMVTWRNAPALARDSERPRLEQQVRSLDSEARFDLELRGQGRLEIPAGLRNAEVHLFRFVWTLGARQEVRPVALGARAPPGDWYPVPIDEPVTELAEPPPRLGQPTSASRLDAEFDRVLAAGSYLLWIDTPDGARWRLPFALRPGEVFRPPAAGPVPPGPAGFLHVAGGTFEYGGDRSAPGSATLSFPDCAPFWIQQREVTWAEYAEFLNDPAIKQQMQQLATSFAPRLAGKPAPWAAYRDAGGDYVIPAAHAGLPVFAISFADAERYARWRTGRARAAGTPFRFTLPTELEWAKAASGADGRPYPWGGTYYPVHDFRHDRAASWRPVMTHPRDVSPYGVHDLVGGVGEWTRAAADGAPVIRGATFRPGVPAHRARRNAVRVVGAGPDRTDPDVGFRLVAHRIP